MRDLRFEHLNHDQKHAYINALDESHMMDVQVYTYNKNENLTGIINPSKYNIVSGQVDVDITDPTKPSRKLSMNIYLDKRTDFKDAVENGPFHPAKFIEVVYRVYVASLTNWVAVPVFYGTPSHIEYDELNETLVVEALSKESLMLPPNKPKRHDSAALDITDVKTFRLHDFIKRVAMNHGETKFRLGKAGSKTKVQIHRKQFDQATKSSGTWPFLFKVAKDNGFHLYYDREGYLVLRNMPNTNVQNFHWKDNVQWNFVTFTHVSGGRTFKSNCTTLPTVIWDEENYRNRVDVFALRTKHSKHPSLIYSLRYDVPGVFGSTTDMERNGVPRSMLEIVNHNGVMKEADARHLASRILSSHQLMAQNAQFQALPVPHLEPWGMCRVDGPNHWGNAFLARTFSIPLTPNDLMTVGFTWRMHSLGKWRRRLHHGKSQ